MPSDIPEVPECKVTRTDDGRFHLTHESGRTATAHTDRGAMLVGMALRTLAQYAEPEAEAEAAGVRPAHLEWTGDGSVLGLPQETGGAA